MYTCRSLKIQLARETTFNPPALSISSLFLGLHSAKLEAEGGLGQEYLVLAQEFYSLCVLGAVQDYLANVALISHLS